MSCHLCSDFGWRPQGDARGWLPLFDQHDVVAERCHCVKQTADTLMLRAGVPKLFAESRISTDWPGTQAAAVTKWVAQPTPGLFICGPVGTGKTRLAAGVTRAVIDAGRVVLFRRAADIYREVRDTFDRRESERALLARYETAPVLVIDDIGSGSLSDHERRVLLDLLDVRLNEVRPTIATSNLTLADIGSRMDERIASRLSSYTLMLMGGTDRRRSRAR